MSMPTESGQDLFLRAAAAMAEAIKVLARESATTTRDDRDRHELLPAYVIAKENGYHVSTLSRWCKQGLIEADQPTGDRGHWRLTRAAFESFKNNRGRHTAPRPRRRRLVAAVAA